jgi:hypothetical protein
MTAIRFFTDEDVYAAVTTELRRAGFDAVSTPEVDRLAESDESQLTWAASEDRVLVTFNVGHFAALHDLWMARPRDHAGIIVSRQRTIGEVLRRLLNLAGALDSAAMKNRLEFLGDW